jgi:CRP-like cAMP-binding protein
LVNIANIAPLDQVGWLAGQSKDFRDWAAEVGRWRRYGAGQFVYQAGDVADGLYGLAVGSLEITFPLVAEEPVSIYRAEIGFWIGDAAELAEIARMVSLMAASESKLLHLPSHAIQQLLSSQPEHWRAFYRLGALNSRTAIMLLSEALSLTVRARVSRRLLQLAERSHEASITQDDLAKLVGVTRGTLRRCLDDLAARGAIEMRYRRLRVLDANILAAFRDEQ